MGAGGRSFCRQALSWGARLSNALKTTGLVLRRPAKIKKLEYLEWLLAGGRLSC